MHAEPDWDAMLMPPRGCPLCEDEDCTDYRRKHLCRDHLADVESAEMAQAEDTYQDQNL